MASFLTQKQDPNILKNEIDFLTHVNTSKGIMTKYVRQKKGLDENTFAQSLNITLQELQALEKDNGKPSPGFRKKMKEILQ